MKERRSIEHSEIRRAESSGSQVGREEEEGPFWEGVISRAVFFNFDSKLQ